MEDGNGIRYFRSLSRVKTGSDLGMQDDTDERAHFVCADGDILTIPAGGKARSTAATPMNDHAGFALYA